MKKKVLFFVTALVASAFFVPNVHAASDPVYYENFANNKEIFLANGTPITIEERTDSVEGALITWEGGQQLVTGEVGVFGGYHDDTTEKVDTSITMNGGTVRNIIGGGLHASEVGNAKITLNGGTIKVAIYGGGYDGYVWGGEHCTCSSATNAAVPSEQSNVRVDNVVIEVNGGSVTYVMGGGGGYNYVGATSVTINDLEAKANYVVAAGTNGYTGTADLTINGGEIETVKGAMRGTTEEVEILITDGKVDQVYAAAPAGSDSENATVESTTVMITGGEIAAVATGTSGANNAAADDAVLVYDEEVLDESTFANGGFQEENLTTTVTFTVDAFDEQISTEIPKGYIFSDEEIEELNALIEDTVKDTEFEFKGFFSDAEYTKEFDFTKAVEEDTTLYINIEEVQTREEEPEKVNPDTSDINLIVLIGTLLIGTLGLGYTIKNRKFN